MMDRGVIKQFLKPDKVKVILTLSLFLIVALFLRIEIIAYDATIIKYGFPTPLFEKYIDTGWGTGVHYKLVPLGIIIDLIFWYFISCLIIFAYRKFRYKK